MIAAVAAAALALAVPVEPGPGQAFFGRVEAKGPASATHAQLVVDGRVLGGTRTARGRVVFRLRAPPGRHDVVVRFLARGRRVAAARADGAWLLPATAARAAPVRRRDERAAARLAALGRGFRGWAGLWLHDLTTGQAAGWNSDAPFTAASTVKLGLIVAVVDRFGIAGPGARDVRDVATWSSNVATNRLLVLLGGSERAGARIAEERLHRLGATSSTFPGGYIPGTTPLRDAPNAPPVLTWRRTTARDLGRALWTLHAGALGDRSALTRLGLTRGEARSVLALLLSAAGDGDNLGLLRPVYPRSVPLARKEGWITSARHTAALVYLPDGPKVVVVLTYRPDLAPRDSRRLAAAVAALAR
jgi:beta-lactamase class A